MARSASLGTRIAWSALFLFFLVGRVWATETDYYEKTLEAYQVPDVSLLTQEGKKIDLQTYLDPEKLIVLDFIFATCTTICPVLSVSFAHLQKQLGEDADRVQLVSITIDPDNDTPALLKEHIQKYGAQPGWDALTGKRDTIIQVLKAFDSYVSNKMDHYPLTLLRAPGQKQWVRLYGLLSASDLRKECDELLQK